jgi:hypothetical protein
MATPSVTDCETYLGDVSWTTAEITSAYNAEDKAQRARCTIPTVTDPVTLVVSEDYPEDLIEALYRRVAHNLALRGLPLGVQASITDGAVATTQVGGTDAEVRRLEGPYRKRVTG